MKTCSKCQTTKELVLFNKDKGKHDGVSSWCSECNRIYARAYSKKNRDRAVQFANRVKSRLGCLKCGIKTSYLIQFHHLEADDKEASIAALTQRSSGKPSFKKIKKEMRKCVTLCANHHIEFHHFERTQDITIQQYLSCSYSF